MVQPSGVPFNLHPGKTHVVRLRMKPEGDNFFAQAGVRQYLFSVQHDSPRVASDCIMTDGQWHDVELRFRPEPDCDFWNLFLEVTGVGQARFSDFEYIVR